MISISIASELKENLPELKLGCLLANVKVESSSNELTSLLSDTVNTFSDQMSAERIRLFPAVKASKDAYRILGKDPNRYRPAAEALLRRVANGKGLYQVNNVVDILNLLSVNSGFSIGGYDAHNITGDVQFGIGESDEVYEGIGRGSLNIENLPVFRDHIGSFGSPTSDSVRTKVTSETKQFLMVFIAFNQSNRISDLFMEAEKLMKKYASAKQICCWVVE